MSFGGGSMVEATPKFVWEKIPGNTLTTALPFLVKLSAVNEDKELMVDYEGNVQISALACTVCLAEGFDNNRLGLWQPACLPAHYEHGFDSEIVAPDSTHSLFLKGGNDSNFGMTLKLPTPNDDTGAPVTLPLDAESDDPSVFDGQFRPDSVSFHVRTDNEKADAGHFILGESNEVNKRVAQFQFTKDGRMGLLGTGGTTHGATPYVPNRWYRVELRFDWTKREVAFYVDGALQQRQIPFRRPTSSFIGACALGNRDKCTTWFDSIVFVKETLLFHNAVVAQGGYIEAWVGPLREESAKMGFVLRVEDSAGNVGDVLGPLWPLTRVEGAQRAAINNAALADFTELLNNDSSSDVVFLVEGRMVHAHRCILTARCETFRGMFNSSMREGSKSCQEVPIHEVSYRAFLSMLQYIYGGAIVVPEDLAVELLGLADRYLLSGLKLLSGFTLARMVSVETVARIIQAADRWDSPRSQLKQLCLDYILANYEQVVSHPVFEELSSSPHLLLEIARSAVRIVSPSVCATQSTSSSTSSPRPGKRSRH
mmetsp:Transcript_4603/g.11213  ORF Transcript_4603/g.11213 Transcript_4603/m.11213 type:complete len:540 (+) Transcript_4603:63-1682(+)